MKVVQISDTHLTVRGGITNKNFESVVEYVNTVLRPDLVINTGDIAILSPDMLEDKATAVTLHRSFDAPVLLLPGNHDVGEPNDEPWMAFDVSTERVDASRRIVGEDRFVHTFDDWALIGLNSEVLASGLPYEEEQWEWLAETFGALGDRKVVLFLHKPLWDPIGWPGPHRAGIDPASSERLLGLAEPGQIRAAGSGHLHRFRRTPREGIYEVWAPSTAFTLHTPLAVGEFDHLGVVEWTFEGEDVKASFRAPHDLTEVKSSEIPEVRDTLSEIQASVGAQ